MVQYIRTQRTPDALNILLEYVSGGSIASNLAKNGPMEEGRVKVYVKQLLKGLHYLHEKNIMHRDIKVRPGGKCACVVCAATANAAAAAGCRRAARFAGLEVLAAHAPCWG